MRKLLLTICLALYTVSTMAQLNRAIDITGEWDKDKLTQYASNVDYCPYYLVVNLKQVVGFSNIPGPTYTTTVMGQSKKTMYSLQVSGTMGYVNANVRYHCYRGDINSKVNVNFKYALPVKHGTPAKIHLQNNNDYSIVFEMNSSVDTVYACRGGIVCDDDLFDTSNKGYRKAAQIITIYHNDGTMAEYKMFSRNLVYPGDVVNIGTPIAICEGSVKTVSVGAYFLDKNKVKLDGDGRKHSHFRPFYQVLNSGAVRLETGNSYTAEITEEMIMQDMSKGEQKKYLKNNQKSNKK